jgi:hypothetical protein
VQAARGTLIAYATAPGVVAIDGSGRNGLYTAHMLQHLPTPRLGVEQLFKKVREGVLTATRGKQLPWGSSSLIGEFFFALPPASNPTPDGRVLSALPAAGSSAGGLDPEAEMWHLVKESMHIEDILAFLNTYPNGRLAPVARLKLQQLQRQTGGQRAESEYSREEYKTIYDSRRAKRTSQGKLVGYSEVFEDGGGMWFWSQEIVTVGPYGIEELRSRGVLKVYVFLSVMDKYLALIRLMHKATTALG